MTLAPSNRRWWLWLLVLTGAAWLAVFGDKTPVATEAESGQLVTHQANPKAPVDKPALAALSAPSRGKTSPAPLISRQELILHNAVRKPITRDLFASGSWSPPAAIVLSPSTLPSGPPPLPFVFLGKKNEGLAWEIYLGRGDDSFVVRQGTVIDGLYRVETVKPPALQLTYLPLGQTQSMAIGDAP